MNNGKICVSVCAETADELIEQIRRAEELADVIEIRFDNLTFAELDKFLTLFKETKLSVKSPILAAMHKSVEDRIIDDSITFGSFSVWDKVLESRVAKYFDPFQRGFSNLLLSGWNHQETLPPDARRVFKNAQKHKFILSYHNFEKVPDNLVEGYEKMKAPPVDIVKIAVQASDLADTIPLWKILEKAKSENQPIIPIAMGESGKWTRILALAHGAFMTYASLDAGSETAPGQVSARDLREVYRAQELDETTNVYGILGNNTGVSLSPYIHNTAFKYHKLNSVFVPLQVHDLDEFMRRMVKPATRAIELNFRGFSVTIPHKKAIIRHLDFLDATAEKIGAVNTVKIEDGKLFGYNTDARGFIEPLLDSYGDLGGARVAILGAGGAARACVYALKAAGARATIFARDLTKAASLAEDFEVDLQELPKTENRKPKTAFAAFDILVNTTPLGMKGKAEGETPATAEQLEGLRLVYDLVYTPFQTALMAEADRAGIPKIGGLAMLIAQAVEQQKIWTGLEAPVTEMSRTALERLK